jgi:hypothetical protein
MVLLILVGAIALAGIVGGLVVAFRDGYRRVPTR